MSSDNIKYTQVQFIETVLDIANNGWANSIIGEDQKNWVCGRIMSRLPDDWVRAMFQAAVDGINKSDEPMFDSAGNTIPPKNVDFHETTVPPQVATLSEEDDCEEEVVDVNQAEEVCSVTSETKIQPGNNNTNQVENEELQEQEEIDAEDDCAEDAEAQQRRYEAKIDAEDMKLLAEIDAREKAEKAAKEQVNQKNNLLIEKIKEQNNLGNGNKTLSEIAKMMAASKNINSENQKRVDQQQQQQLAPQNTSDDDILMFTVKKQRVVSDNGGDKPTNVIYTPDSVNEGYNYNRKFSGGGGGRISGKRSFITSEPQFAARDLPVHQEELLANNAIGSGGTLNTNDSIAQIDSNYHSKSSVLKSELSPRFKSENLHVGRKQLLKVRQNQIEDIFALQQREQLKNTNNNNHQHHQQHNLFNPLSAVANNNNNHVISDAPTSNNSHLENKLTAINKQKQPKNETSVMTSKEITINSAELLSKKTIQQQQQQQQQQQPLSNNLVRSTDIDPELDANVLLTPGNSGNNNNNNNLAFANSSTKRQLEHILRLKELTKQQRNLHSSEQQNVIIDTVLNPFGSRGQGLVQSKNTNIVDKQLNIAIGDNELPIFTENNAEEDKMEKELNRADLLMRENNILMRENIIRENNLLREHQQNMMLMNNLESQFQENTNNSTLFRENSGSNLLRRDSFQNNNNNNSSNSFDLSSRIQQISGFKSVQAEKMKKHASDLLLQQREATNRAFARNVKKLQQQQQNNNNATSSGQSLYTVQENNNNSGCNFKEFNSAANHLNFQTSLNSHNLEINNLSINVPSNNGNNNINSSNSFLNSNSFQKSNHNLNIPNFSGNLGNQPTSAPGGIGIQSANHSQNLQNVHNSGINSNNTNISPDEQIFTCPWPGCGKTFRRKAYVKKHMELHSTHKAYGCDLCEVRCRQYAGLYIHYKGVHKLRLKKHNVRYYPSDHVEGSAFLRLDHTGEPQRILDDGSNEMNLQGNSNSMLFGN